MPKKPQTVRDILDGSATAADLLSQVRKQSDLLASVSRELGPPLSEHLVAALMHDKQLLLYTSSSVWASRLRFSSRTLRERLARQGVIISKVTVRITLPRIARRPGRSPERQLSRENSLLIETIAENIDDAGLRAALRRLSRHGR